MYMRGVFFALFCLLICSSGTQAVDYAGELTWTVGTREVSSALTLDLEKDLPWCDLTWGFDASIGLSQPIRPEGATRWALALPLTPQVQVIVNHNQDHFTSADSFRMINKNNYGEESYFASLQTQQLRMGYVRKIPFRNKDVVDALFAESVLEVGSLSLIGMQMRFAGALESGSAGILQAEGSFGSFDVVGARGWQIDSKGEESQGSVFELKQGGSDLSATLVVQKIDPGFLSLLAKTNRYTPNRQGWQLHLSSDHDGFGLGLNVRRHRNLEETRDYNQLSWKFDFKDKCTGVEWRIQPTRAFVISYDQGDTLFQLDPLNSTLRTDFKVQDTALSFRLDAVRSIARLECRFERIFEWRFIVKYDFLLQRSHYSILAQSQSGGKGNSFRLEVGQYDRGNMSSGFNNPRSFCISWGWKF